MAHDLRSPIIAEQSIIKVILSLSDKDKIDKYFEYLQEISKTNDELLRIVNNILTIYHLESGEWILKKDSVDLNQLVKEAVSLLDIFAKSKNVEILTELKYKTLIAEIDRDEIKRVLINLINNAIQHSPKMSRVYINSEKKHDKAYIIIKDQGSGIPESEINKIFSKYPTKKRKLGTGLGLYLSKKIINAHNGEIWFETKINEGTNFIFTLPIVSAS